MATFSQVFQRVRHQLFELWVGERHVQSALPKNTKWRPSKDGTQASIYGIQCVNHRRGMEWVGVPIRS